MAKTNSLLHCSLVEEEGFDKFANLDIQRMVVEHIPIGELVPILKEHHKGRCWDWPVEQC